MIYETCAEGCSRAETFSQLSTIFFCLTLYYIKIIKKRGFKNNFNTGCTCCFTCSLNRGPEHILVNASPQDTYAPLPTLTPAPWDQSVPRPSGSPYRVILIVMEVGSLTKQVYAAQLKVSSAAMVMRDTNAGATHPFKVKTVQYSCSCIRIHHK